ncbi:MAG: TolC family protein [bacterium]
MVKPNSKIASYGILNNKTLKLSIKKSSAKNIANDFILFFIAIYFIYTISAGIQVVKAAASPSSASNQALQISLPQAIKRAVSNQGNILRAEHIIAEETDLKKASYAGLMPDISIVSGGIWTQTKDGLPLFASANGMREFIGQIRLIVPIFDPKSYAVISLARSNLNLARYRLQLARLVVAAQITQDFYGLILLKDEIKIQQKALDNVKKIFNITKNEYKAGNLPRLDVVQTSFLVTKLQTDVNVLKSRLKALQHVFSMEIFYKRFNADKLLPILYDKHVFNYRLPTLNSLILNAIKRQPLIKIAKAEIRSAGADVSINKAAKLPSVQGGAAYGEDTINSVDIPNLGWQFFVTLNIPISNFGLHSDYIDAANERLMALISAKSSLKLSIKKKLAADYGLAAALKKRLSGEKILVKESGTVFKMTEEGYLAGEFNALALQEAQNNRIKARLSLVKAINRFYLSIAQLDIDIGIIPSGGVKL